MEEANATQIGGDHYRCVYQHWDFMENNGIGYLEGCATKYVTRWRVKGQGRRDLEKTLHYIEKLRELHRQINRMPRGIASLREINSFNEANKLGREERSVVYWLCRWRCDEDLATARLHTENLLAEQTRIEQEREQRSLEKGRKRMRRSDDHPRGFDPEQDIEP